MTFPSNDKKNASRNLSGEKTTPSENLSSLFSNTTKFNSLAARFVVCFVMRTKIYLIF